MFGLFKRRRPRSSYEDSDKIAPSLPALTDENFRSLVLEQDTRIFVFCWATWCGPCHRMAEVVETVAKRLKANIVYYKLNIEVATHTASTFNISGTPTFLLFEGGKLRASRFGSLSAKKLIGWIEENTGQAS